VETKTESFVYHIAAVNMKDAAVIGDILRRQPFIQAVDIGDMFDPYSGANVGAHITCKGFGVSLDGFVANVKQSLRER
jgi:hypothetical protein